MSEKSKKARKALIEGNRQEAANYFSQLRGDFGNLPITAIAARLLK
jgi:hypothetical protein